MSVTTRSTLAAAALLMYERVVCFGFVTHPTLSNLESLLKNSFEKCRAKNDIRAQTT